MGWFVGVGSLALGLFAAYKILAEAKRMSEMACITHHVENGGCLDEFKAAMLACRRPRGTNAEADTEACVAATVALRGCFAGNPEWFEHHYLRRMDEGLDQDTKPTPEEIQMAKRQGKFRWWTGMRRS